MKSNISAKKLSIYFAIVLILFSIVLGTLFNLLFKRQTIRLQEQNLITRAQSIAQTFSEGTLSRGHMSGYGSFLRSINAIAGADAWIVNENNEIITAQSGHHSANRNPPQNSALDGSQTSDLPENAEYVIQEAFQGNTSVSQDFSSVLNERTITVAVPVETSSGTIPLAILLHSPISGLNDSINQGRFILFISIGIGLCISFLLSIWMSKAFTGPILLKEAESVIQLEEDRKNFLAKITHELRTPITVMKSSLENFQLQEDVSLETMKKHNNELLEEVTYLQLLVSDLLDLSTLESPEFKMEMSPVALPDLISDVLRSSRRLAAHKNIQILSKDIENINIIGDYSRLRQMFLVILNNAIKFSNVGENIEIQGNKNSLSISDYGSGIQEKDLPYIFDKFYKNNTSSNTEGTGLGLSIAKEIANRHNIEISVNSQVGKKTTFTFTFPKQ